MSTLLRQADDKFDRVNEQQTRQVINTRLGDNETREQRKTTSRGGLSTYQGKITLANGANNNISLDYATYVYITGPTGAFSITGIKNGEKGAFAILRNSTSQAMTIANESASSSANNRIKCPGNADIVLSATNGASAFLQYDTSINRWVVISSPASALDRLAAALSVLGRSANSTGSDADIATTSGSNAVLRESGGAIGWGKISDSNITASSLTNASLAAGVAVANLGYTPVNKAGDSMTGRLNTQRLTYLQNIDVSSTDLNNLITAGFYDGSSLTNSPDGTTSWFHIEVTTHSGTNVAGVSNVWICQKAWGLTGVSMWVRWCFNGSWGSWQKVYFEGNPPSAIRGGFANLQASATGTTANIAVSADEIAVENSSNVYQTLRSVSLTINSAASGANGLDTGALAASTWYSVWVIWNGTTVAGLISLSQTAPTLPNGYTHKARVGYIRTDGTANKFPLSFQQYGRNVQYKIASGSNVAVLRLMSSGVQGSTTTPTWVAVGVSSFVPPTAAAIDFLVTTNGLGTINNIVAPNNSYGGLNSTTNWPPHAMSASFEGNKGRRFYLESTNIYWASNSSNLGLACLGWEDNL